jgi:16S rRNA (uracil1498-N3)-methyltransferase
MSAPRVFVDQPCVPNVHITLEPNDARHLVRVLRMKAGEAITIVHAGEAWHAKLDEVGSDHATATIIEQLNAMSPELPVELIVLQAVPKGMKMDDVVEKVVELGAARIVPLRCARSYGGDSEVKIERWRRIARAAAQQSQRLIVPDVEQPLRFHDAIDRFAATSHVIVAHEGAAKGSLAAALQRNSNAQLAIVIGPEGSFTSDELRLATNAGCDLAWLGPTILRTETAASAMLAAIAALRGWW